MAYTTETTILAAYRTANDAQAAAQDLQTAGIPREHIYLEADSSSQTGSYETRSTRHEGGVSGWFKSLFQDDDAGDRSRYEQAIGSGNYLLSVDSREEQVDAIEDILNRHNPLNIDTSVDDSVPNAAAATASPATSNTARSNATRTTAGTGGATGAVPVVEEELQVGKRQVLRGGARVYSRVVEQPVHETIGLREEQVRVDRQKVNRPATEADFAAGKEQVIEVQEFAEQPVVSKQARVVEEVRVGKEASERRADIQDTVRHTEVRVEPLSGARGNSGLETENYDTDFRQDFQNRYGSSASYEDYAPGYQYGFESASDPRYKGRSYGDVENDLRADYGRRYSGNTWEKMKDSVRYGWDKVTGKSST